MKIQIPDDFDPEKIIRSGQCFRASAQPDGSFHFITGKNMLSLSPLGADTWEADCTPYAWKRVWAPYFDLSVSYKSLRRSIPAKDHFSGLRPDMEKVSVSCGRILLKCSSPLLSPKGNPFPLYGVPWKNFVLPQERKLQKMGGLFTHFPPRQRSENYLSMN